MLALSTTVYAVSRRYSTSGFDVVAGYFLALLTGLAISKRAGNKAARSAGNRLSITAYTPADGDAVFYYSRPRFVNMLIGGLAFIALGVYIALQSLIFIPVFFFTLGIFQVVTVLSRYATRSPQLVLSQNGVWTPRLGLKNWQQVKSIKLTDMWAVKYRDFSLQILLNKEEGGVLGETVDLRVLSDQEKIKETVDRYRQLLNTEH